MSGSLGTELECLGGEDEAEFLGGEDELELLGQEDEIEILGNDYDLRSVSGSSSDVGGCGVSWLGSVSACWQRMCKAVGSLSPVPTGSLPPNSAPRVVLKRVLQHPFLVPWTQELRRVLVLAGPISVSYFLSFSILLSNLLFVGHLGAAALGALALGTMYCNVTGYSFIVGMLTPLDTLATQAYGAKNYKHVGVLLQRSWAVIAVGLIPVVLLWVFSAQLLTLANQPPEVIALASSYIRISLATLPGYALYESIKRYLQVQSIVVITTAVTFVGLLINLALCPLLVLGLGLGFLGAPIAYCITMYATVALLGGYVMWTGIHKRTWGGWDIKGACSGWKQYWQLGLPGTAMLCAEWWGFEIHALVAGLIGTVQLAAQTVLMNTIALSFMLPLGIAFAASTRVGNHLGACKPFEAKLAALVSIGLCLVVATVQAVLLYSLHSVWGYAFSSDMDVIALVGTVTPIICAFMVFDGLQGVASGVLRGCGRQMLGAVVNISAYWLFALPLGCMLALYFGWGIVGQWIALGLGAVSIATIYMLALWRSDWDKQVSNAQLRMAKEGGAHLGASSDAEAKGKSVVLWGQEEEVNLDFEASDFGKRNLGKANTAENGTTPQMAGLVTLPAGAKQHVVDDGLVSADLESV